MAIKNPTVKLFIMNQGNESEFGRFYRTMDAETTVDSLAGQYVTDWRIEERGKTHRTIRSRRVNQCPCCRREWTFNELQAYVNGEQPAKDGAGLGECGCGCGAVFVIDWQFRPDHKPEVVRSPWDLPRQDPPIFETPTTADIVTRDRDGALVVL